MMLSQVSKMSARLEDLEDELAGLTSAMDEAHAVSRLEVKGARIKIGLATLIAITKNTLRHICLHARQINLR